MRSRLALLLLIGLLGASAGDSRDLFAAVGEEIWIPLETKLDHTSGALCNRYVWTFEGSANRYVEEVATVDGNCQKTECQLSNCFLSNNGSLHFHHVTHQDSGLYTVTTYHLNGAYKANHLFQLYVLDVVSAPVLKLQCVSNDSFLVNCSVEKGTKPQILLTINGEMFRESETSHINVTKSLPPPWNVHCSASNEVSQKVTTIFSKACPDPLLDPGLDISCNADGSVEIFCAVGSGSDPQYSWIVDGKTLRNDSDSSWRVIGNRIKGDADPSANVSCVAWNLVSQVQTPQQVIHCQGWGKQLGVTELYVKGALFIMYNALLLRALMGMKTTATANH